MKKKLRNPGVGAIGYKQISCIGVVVLLLALLLVAPPAANPFQPSPFADGDQPKLGSGG
ncbi:hypothetical protein [Meiothermus sp.]|uniref:hypothetical protein n=1 Tax=Meiothermus sp. TaxID=1955249 RepID=UPI0026362AEF|nr:hypothetical protein [Meiothermus sp.]